MISSGNIVLLGVNGVMYENCRLTQYEPLLNSNHLREHEAVVGNDIARCHSSGTQNFLIGGRYFSIPLHFNGNIIMMNPHEPTEEELTARVKVVWI